MILVLTYPIDKKNVTELRYGVNDHFDMLKSRSFEVRKIYTDPDQACSVLRGKFPGVDIDQGGAGDHVERADIKIRRLKEIIRSTLHGLKWKNFPSQFMDDLVTFSVNRINCQAGRNQEVPPRVKFTGSKAFIEKRI